MARNYDEMIGEWREFRKWEAREHKHIRTDLKGIHKKLDSLSAFKWRMVGLGSSIALIGSWFGATILKYLGGAGGRF